MTDAISAAERLVLEKQLEVVNAITTLAKSENYLKAMAEFKAAPPTGVSGPAKVKQLLLEHGVKLPTGSSVYMMRTRVCVQVCVKATSAGGKDVMVCATVCYDTETGFSVEGVSVTAL